VKRKVLFREYARGILFSGRHHKGDCGQRGEMTVGDFFTRFEQEAPNAKTMNAMDFFRSSIRDISVLDQKIAVWLNELRDHFPRKPEI
jgi:hypothetical protein